MQYARHCRKHWRALLLFCLDFRLVYMSEMRENGTLAIIGLDDTCSTEALVAAAWNIPILSYKCSDTEVSNKNVYQSFARTLPPSSKVSKSVVSLLLAFQWTRIVVVAGSRPAWGSELKDAIKDICLYNDITIAATKEYTDYIPQHIHQMESIVAETYRITRVYVFLGEHIALVDFVRCLQAKHLLDNGEYVVISVDNEIYDPRHKETFMQRDYLDPYLQNKTLSPTDVKGFRSVLKLTPSHPRNPRFHDVCQKIKKLSIEPPFCVPYHEKIFGSISVPIHAAYLYDAVIIYARALTELLKENRDPKNGTAVLERILNRSYSSIQGFDVFIDKNGDAEGNFTLVALMHDKQMEGSIQMSMQPVGCFKYNSNNESLTRNCKGTADDCEIPEFYYLDESRPIQWLGGSVPLAQPPCGFTGERCGFRADPRLATVGAFIAGAVLLAGIFLLKHYRYEHKLACLLWKIEMKDVTIIPTESVETTIRNKSLIQVCRHSCLQLAPGSGQDTATKRAYACIGLYKGNIVAIKKIYKRSVDITRSIRSEMKQMREVRHDNLLPFIGASADPGSVYLLTGYCARGSLEDILANEDLHLDNMFISSLVSDILKGMIYLHDSEVVSHGNLRASNCLVDSKWVLQIADFGLHEFKAGQDEPDNIAKNVKRALYRAPELLRSEFAPARGTQKGDVYSFAIVLYEILSRNGPWGSLDMTDEEIIACVKSGANALGGRALRPPIHSLAAEGYVIRCLEACWDEDPDLRPDIRFVRVKLKEMQAGLKPNIFDNMLAIMDKYAYNLEGLVQERTNQLTIEKKKTEALLHRMLPKTVAESLKRGEPVQAESFPSVTIYFSDVVGFTELSARSTPLQVVDLLNDLYTCCDSIISHYDVYKVETIGDAYMVVSGLPVRNGISHAAEIASMALHILDQIRTLPVKHLPGELLQIRIGIHSGPCVAGVVGLKMPRYCLFGDTVNTASRMESTGEALRIHISADTYRLLEALSGFRCEERGLTFIKGKGEMRTYWLLGEDRDRRLERIRQRMVNGTPDEDLLCNELPVDAPDLILGSTTGLSPGHVYLKQLHQRARLSCSALYAQATHEKNICFFKIGYDVPYWNCVLKKNYVCPDPSIKFYLYTPESPYKTRLDMRDHGSLHRAGFRRDRKNVIVVHGFNGTESKTPMTFLRDAYLSRGYQVVTVDWEPLTRFPCYLSALSNTKLVGQCAAQMYSYLMIGGGRAKATTCVGHSLGAHICGMISNHLTRKQHKIIGLDPAKPLVDRFGSRKFRLTREDAHIVQVIHTNAGFLGEEAQVGHLDFCVNGGRIQPYCKGHPIRRSRCSHFLSACYLAQAVRSKTPLRGVPCKRGCPRSGIGHWVSALLPAPIAPPPLPDGELHMFSIGDESTDQDLGTYCVTFDYNKQCPFD